MEVEVVWLYGKLTPAGTRRDCSTSQIKSCQVNFEIDPNESPGHEACRGWSCSEYAN